MAEKHWRSVQSPFFSGKWISKWPWGGVQRYTFQWRMLRSKKLMWKHMLVRIWRKRNILPFLVGLQTAMTTMEINMEVPQKFPHRSTWSPCTNLTGEWPATFSFHLMAYYSDFLIYWAMTLLLVSIWSLWFSSSSLFSQIFWGTSSHWDLFIPSNPSKLGDF